MSPGPDPATPRKSSAKVRQACDLCHARKANTNINTNTNTSINTSINTQASPSRVSANIQDNFLCPSIHARDMEWCVNAWYKYKYAITPILYRQQTQECLQTYSASPKNYALLMSCCAIIADSPDILPPKPSPASPMSFTTPSPTYAPNLPLPEYCISEVLRARHFYTVAEGPSLADVQTSFFLYCYYFCAENDNAAWFYLREAMTALETVRLHEEETYAHMTDVLVATYSRRMFWTLFITERAYALQRHRPLTLQCTLDLPRVDPSSPDADILPGFLDLISLFRHFDTDFVATWNCSVTSSLSAAGEPAQLQRLQGLLRDALPGVAERSETQQADLLISRQWLKVIVWKLCVSRTLLSGTDSEDSMSLSYPSSIAREMVLVSRLLPAAALEANGIGILEKVFDVGCSLADLLSLDPASNLWSAMDMSLDTLMETVKIVGTTFGGSYKHLDILIDKANLCLMQSVDRGLPLPADALQQQQEQQQQQQRKQVEEIE
ncbi:putative sucrose utilization protein SUC1 [Colletotrichum orbiculare MAFF 240422]|uniref:Sucrose utilization protein SUC1 n=1 Tax=Colletotrichum orbiculare (strain 104-T / ATCC 96160 / CBS 514.97 / LARS 414 / MAFF 240422) TaxID=1213857 RepID=N4VP96_COLOR|nr:putative sucrose utilization protein SUC1 [Colletotrichum orbiculare MAFF 240422]